MDMDGDGDKDLIATNLGLVPTEKEGNDVQQQAINVYALTMRYLFLFILLIMEGQF